MKQVSTGAAFCIFLCRQILMLLFYEVRTNSKAGRGTAFEVVSDSLQGV